MKNCLQINKGFVLFFYSGIPETNLNQTSDLKEFGYMFPEGFTTTGITCC
jgi:hypothetical protein